MDTKKLYLGDPSLFVPTRVIVLLPFCVGGQRKEIGETVEVTYEVARDLVARGRAKIK